MKSILGVLVLIFLVGCGSSDRPSNPPTNNAVTSPTDLNLEANEVLESAPSGTPVGVTVSARDPDGDLVSYALTIDGDGHFSIDSTSGVVTTVGQLDAETTSSFSITVVARSSDGTSKSAVFTITVIDVNDNPPLFVGSNIIEVPEGSFSAGVASFEDPDVSDTLAYSIVGGADQTLININPISGEMTFGQISDFETQLDADSDGTYEVTVTVSDGIHSVSEDISIFVAFNEPPEVEVIFPPANSLFSGDRVNVRGIATDPDGDTVQVKVEFAGVSQTVNVIDGEWITSDMEIDNELEIIQISVTAVDTYSTQKTETIIPVDVSVPLVKVRSLVANNAGTELYAADSMQLAILKIDLTTGKKDIVARSSESTGVEGGIEFNPFFISLDEDGNRIFFSDPVNDAIYEANIDTGVVSLVLGNLNEPGDLEYINGHIVVSEGLSTSPTLSDIDLSTLTKTTISSTSIGSGVSVFEYKNIEINSSGDTIYVNGAGTIFSIDRTNGTRSVVSGGSGNIGSGPDANFAFGLSYNESDQELFAIYRPTGQILQIDISTGERTLLPNPGGLVFEVNGGMDLIQVNYNPTLLVSDFRKDTITAVNVTSGVGNLVTSYDNFSEYDFSEPYDLAINELTGELYITDRGADDGELFLLNVETSDLEIRSPKATVNGLLAGSEYVAVCDNGDTFIAYQGSIIYKVQNDGSKIPFSGPGYGSGDLFSGSILAIDCDDSTLWAIVFNTNSSSIYRIDSSGSRQLVSSATIDSGPGILAGTDIMVDPFGEILVSESFGNIFLLGVNGTTGQSAALSDSSDSGLLLESTEAVTISSIPGEYYILDYTDGKIFRVDSSGSRNLVSRSRGSIVGDGADLYAAEAMVFDPAKNLLYATGLVWSSVIAIDPLSGDRAVIAK